MPKFTTIALVFAFIARLAEGVRQQQDEDEELQPAQQGKCMNIVGHRGSSVEAPENTMASLKLAFEQGAQGVEFDIQKSKDGKIFVLHDDNLTRTASTECPERLCGDGGKFSPEVYASMLNTDISQLSYDDFIQHVDVGSKKDVKYAAERPRLLEDMMQQVPDNRFVLCEVKGGDNSTADAVVAMVKDKQWTADKLRFIGFDLNVMVRIKGLLNKAHLDDFKVIYVQVGNNETKALADIVKAKEYGLDGVDFEADPAVVTANVVQAARDQSLQIGVWVWKKLPESDTKNTADALKKLNIDFFTSDLPSDVRSTIEHCDSF